MHKTTIWKRMVRDTRGQDLIEYALMAGFVATALCTVLPGAGYKMHKLFQSAEAPMVRIVSAVLAALCLAFIIMRRAPEKSKDE